MIGILCEEPWAIWPERVQAHRVRVPHQRYFVYNFLSGDEQEVG